MKKITLILAMLVGFATMAQESNEQNEHHRKGPPGLKMKMHKATDFSPEQLAILQTKRLTLALDLDKNQQDELQKFNLKNIKERRAHLEKRKKQMESGEKKKLTSDQKFEMANARLDHAIAKKEELKDILGEEKFKEHQKLQAKRRAMGKKKMAARKKQRAIKRKKMGMHKKH